MGAAAAAVWTAMHACRTGACADGWAVAAVLGWCAFLGVSLYVEHRLATRRRYAKNSTPSQQ